MEKLFKYIYEFIVIVIVFSWAIDFSMKFLELINF